MPSTKFEDLILRDITGNRPAFGIPGRLFYDTTLEKWERDTGAAWEDCEPAAGGGGGWSYPQDFRLTLESGVPVSTSDQANKTTVYVTPYRGNSIALYDGASAWNIRTSAEMSVAVGAYTASKLYDVFIYDNAGTPTIETLVWTNATTRATALAYQDGRLVKSGVTTRLYIGTIYIDAGQKCQDTLTARYVYNYYNRVKRLLYVAEATYHTYNNTTPQLWNNSATNNQLNYIVGVIEDTVQCSVSSLFKAGTANNATYVRMYLNGAAIDAGFSLENGVNYYISASAVRNVLPSLGYSYLNTYEWSYSNSSFNDMELEAVVWG